MRLQFTKKFAKQRGKLPEKIQAAFGERLRLFLQDPFHPLLRNHELHGPYADCRSVNITGDIRAVYRHPAPHVAEFIRIGTQAELYE